MDTLYTLHNNTNVVFDADIQAFRKLASTKNLATGQIFEFYRVSQKFILREKVLMGFKYNFLDAIELFTIEGYKITSVYRIRQHTWSRDASMLIVAEHLKHYLYSKLNLKMFFDSELNALYKERINVLEKFDIINNFITSHEK